MPLLGNAEPAREVSVRLDSTSPTVEGLPAAPCVIWPPNGKMVHVADVVGADGLSGIASVQVTGSADEPAPPDDIRIVGGSVDLRATRSGSGVGRTYALDVAATDRAGNATDQQGTCLVPHDRG